MSTRVVAWVSSSRVPTSMPRGRRDACEVSFYARNWSADIICKPVYGLSAGRQWTLERGVSMEVRHAKTDDCCNVAGYARF